MRPQIDSHANNQRRRRSGSDFTKAISTDGLTHYVLRLMISRESCHLVGIGACMGTLGEGVKYEAIEHFNRL